jgi:cytoskeletal protein CcmA (bactofilin family)
MFSRKPDTLTPLEPAKAASPVANLNPLRAMSAAPPALPTPAPRVAAAALAPAPVVSSGAPVASSGSSVIGADLVIVGNLQSNGEVTVDGQVQGDLQAQRIIIGQHARITGGIIADEVIVQGMVMGSIRGNRVTLQASSKVEGDIMHQSLAIEQGAYFEGKSRRSDNPLETQQRSNGIDVGQALQNGSLN